MGLPGDVCLITSVDGEEALSVAVGGINDAVLQKTVRGLLNTAPETWLRSSETGEVLRYWRKTFWSDDSPTISWLGDWLYQAKHEKYYALRRGMQDFEVEMAGYLETKAFNMWIPTPTVQYTSTGEVTEERVPV